jgi:hypothetical protein
MFSTTMDNLIWGLTREHLSIPAGFLSIHCPPLPYSDSFGILASWMPRPGKGCGSGAPEGISRFTGRIVCTMAGILEIIIMVG